MILKCSCQHEYQDIIYGKFMRIHNETTASKTDGLARCTVCEKMNSVGGVKKVVKKEAKKNV